MPKLISIVTPVFNEEVNARECYEAVKRIFEQELPEYDYEHIFCDNFSSDETVPILREIARQDRRVKLILNARNYGPSRSDFNGLMATRGDAVLVLLAADLQDPPDEIPRFVRKWEEGYQVVYGVRRKRRKAEGFLMVAARKLFYRLVTAMSEVEIPLDTGEFQLVDKVVVDALRQFDDYYPYVRGMIATCGFQRTGIAYDWQPRKRGRSKTSFFSLVDQALNGIISTTRIPARVATYVGSLLVVLSILYSLALLIVNLLHKNPLAPPGTTTLIVAVFFFSGIQLFFLGMLGEYVAAIHFQVRKRPLVLERERVNFDDDAQEADIAGRQSVQGEQR